MAKRETKKTPSVRENKQKRLTHVLQRRNQALDYALIVNKLLEADVFPKVLEALETKDKTCFAGVCHKVGITDEMTEYLWKIAFHPPMHHPPVFMLGATLPPNW